MAVAGIVIGYLAVSGDKGHFMTGVAQVQCGIHGDHGAADDHNMLTQLLFMSKYREGLPDMGQGTAGNGAGFRLRAAGGNDRIIVPVKNHLRSCRCAGEQLNAVLLAGVNQAVFIVHHAPLIRHKICMVRLPAEEAFLFVEGDAVTQRCTFRCRFQPGRAAADDRYLFGR